MRRLAAVLASYTVRILPSRSFLASEAHTSLHAPAGIGERRLWFSTSRRVRVLRHLLVLLTLSLSGMAEISAQSLPAEQLARVEYEQRLGSVVPLDAELIDEKGLPARLGSVFGARPVILVLAYYDCPNLCTLVLNGLLESVRNLRFDAGKDFEVLVVSIRPDDSPELAAKKKHTYISRYARPGADRGWHFLTGGAESIRRLSEAVGFHYVYDPQSGHFAHASGIVVLTPNGTVSRYFMGIEYPPKELRLALMGASRNEVGTLAQRLLLLCFRYDPHSGQYTVLIFRILQAAGAGTVLVLAGMLISFAWRDRSRKKRTSV